VSALAYYALGETQTEGIINVGAGAAGALLQPGGNKVQQVLMSAPAITGGVLTAGGTSSIAATAWGALAIPIIGAAVAGATIGLMLLFSRKGPRQKVATTEIVNKVEPLLQDNLRGYLEGPRTVESQRQALENFTAAWQYVLDHCGIPEMGEPGQRCISERQQGGSAPWCPTSTGCDWFTLYRDPIANDVPNMPASSPGASVFEPLASIFGGSDGAGGGGSLIPLLIGGGLIAAAVLL
jgi:hypothetical protein